MTTFESTSVALGSETDSVAVVPVDVEPGEAVRLGDVRVVAAVRIPAGHKIALRPIAAGEAIYKLGSPLGAATRDIAAGEHVHVHNLAVGGPRLARRIGRIPADRARGPWRAPAAPPRGHFLGYRRADGRAGTRNYIAILPSVNCSSTVARLAAQAAGPEVAGRPEFDGVIALNHDQGCALAEGSEGDELLRRTLRGYATHPNIAAVVVLSLGCEVNQPARFLTGGAAAVDHLSIQDLGGTGATVRAIVEWAQAAATRIGELRREPIPLSELTLGLQCGGSDSLSTVTANPTLGVAADLLVAAGGRVILGETPEIYGAEQLLKARAARPELADRIDELIAWWLEHVAKGGARMDDNPSAGNKEGGISTIWEKAIGAVLKGGTSPLQAVVAYADAVEAPGLTFMDTPGYDPVSATGMVAGGATVLAFTTGRGSVFGSRPSPCVKISSSTRLYERMVGDIDFDAGPAMTPAQHVDHGVRLLELIVDTASGALSKSEQLGFGAEEISPWKIGPTL